MIAAIVAVIAAFQSYRSAKQNNDTNEQMIRPRLAVYVESTEVVKSFIDIVVLNEGGGLARDICFSIKGDASLSDSSWTTDKDEAFKVISNELPKISKGLNFIKIIGTFNSE